MADETLKTPSEWCKLLGVEILDPDGWRGSKGRPWADPISEAEFQQRLIVCTQRVAVQDERAEFREARNHGLEARHETREARAVRKAVGEEIAQAVLTTCTRPDVCETCQRVATLAREIGSRDPA